jgi:oxygen-dependent protoporphyrinogen oxidase
LKEVIIVGGGITGLAAAYELEKRNINYLLIEKGNQLGGVIKTERKGDFIFEGGPDCFVSFKPWVEELARELEIEDELICTQEENKGIFVYSKGKLHLLPDGLTELVPKDIKQFLFTPLISVRGKLRMALEVLIPPQKNKEDETLASFVKRRFGKELLDKIAEPLIAGIHASDPETMSLESTFPSFLEMEREFGSVTWGMLRKRREMKRAKREKPPSVQPPKKTFFMSFKKGMQEIVEALEKKIPAHKIILRKEVTGLIKENNFYLINLKSGESFKAKNIILTTPAYSSAKIVKEIDKELSQKLNEIPYAPSITIPVAFKKNEFAHPLKGFGVVVPKSEGRRVMAISWISSKWPYRVPEGYVMLRVFMGGSEGEKFITFSKEEILKIALEEIKIILGTSAEPFDYEIFRFEKSMPQYTLGHKQKIGFIESRLKKLHPSLIITGGAFHGVGIGDCIREGRKAARKILSRK